MNEMLPGRLLQKDGRPWLSAVAVPRGAGAAKHGAAGRRASAVTSVAGISPKSGARKHQT